MTNDLWHAVDTYFADTLVGEDAALSAAAEATAEAGLPNIAVAPNEGKLLHLLARMVGARTILEIGTLGGYSTIWLARALPADGRLISLEYSSRHAEVATANVARAGLADRVEVRVGPALDTLPALDGPFDLVFIDADKPNNPGYIREALRLTRPGGAIVVDNVVRDGTVADAASTNPAVVGTRTMAEIIAAEPRLSATVVQTVGTRGYDGFLLAVVAAGDA